MFRNPFLSGRYGSNPPPNSNEEEEKGLPGAAHGLDYDSMHHSVLPLGELPAPMAAPFGRADVGFSRFPDAAHMKLSIFTPQRDQGVADASEQQPRLQRYGSDRDASVSALIAETEAAMRLAHDLLAEPSYFHQPAISPDKLPDAAPATSALVAPSTVASLQPAPSSEQRMPDSSAAVDLPAPAQAASKEEPILLAAAPAAASVREGPSRPETAAHSEILSVFLVREEEAAGIVSKRLSRRVKPTGEQAIAASSKQDPVNASEKQEESKKANGEPSVAKRSSKHRSSERRRSSKESSVQPVAVPTVPISAVTELVSSIVALVQKRSDARPEESAPPAAARPPLPLAMPLPPSEPPRQPTKLIPPPQVMLGQPPLFSQTVEPVRSPYFAASAQPAKHDELAGAPMAQVLSSVMLPRVGVNNPTVLKPPGGSSRSCSPVSARGAKYLNPTESWLSKGPELQGVHLHLKKATLKPPLASGAGSVFTKDRVSDFNHRAKEHLRLHRSQ
jgi:hypothetical protein